MDGELAGADPKGLIREAYAMPNITEAECRTVFLEWAMTLHSDVDAIQALRILLAHYQPDHAGHYMTSLIAQGVDARRSARPIGRRKRARRGRSRIRRS